MDHPAGSVNLSKLAACVTEFRELLPKEQEVYVDLWFLGCSRTV
jgi:hypothetical protein